ncbi:Glycerophosphodiester phosphodiesterase GDPDL3 [Bienertia sinuspersici]
MSKEVNSPELPVSGQQQITINEDDESSLITDTLSSNHSSCCSFFPCFGSRQPSSARYSTLGGSSSSPSMWERLQQTAENSNNWWAGPLKGLKKIREWSEIIAGPKWKTFIRRFNRAGKPGNGSAKFNYDPLSYALNFDDGPGQNGNFEEDGDFPDFSSRFASIPISCRSSMDLGKNRTPSFS